MHIASGLVDQNTKLYMLSLGPEVLFTWSGSNVLLVTIDGEHVCQVANVAVCWALFDYYLGHSAISPSIREVAKGGWDRLTSDVLTVADSLPKPTSRRK